MNRTVDVGGAIVDLTGWDDLVRACAEGLLDEGHHVELKRGLPPSSHNTEIACDLASLPVNGGVYIVWVRDAGDGKPGDVEGVEECESVKTRLTAIASGGVQPAIPCEVVTVPHPTADGRGCVVCVIPASAAAPHTANERYWGRSSHGKRVLADPEIADLFVRRRNRHDTFIRDLTDLPTSFDPEIPGERSNGHLYLLAAPQQPDPTPSPVTEEHPILLIGGIGLEQSGYGGSSLMSLQFKHPHPDGILAATYRPDGASSDPHFIRVLFGDDGTVRLVSSEGSLGGGAAGGPEDLGTINLAAVTVMVHHFVQAVRLVAIEKGLAGTWQLGVHMDGMSGATAMASRNAEITGRFPEHTYARTVTLAREGFNEAASVTESLLRPLARGLGLDRMHPPTKLCATSSRAIPDQTTGCRGQRSDEPPE